MSNGSATFSPEIKGIISNEEFINRIASTRFVFAVNGKNVTYFNTPAAFDIETSSFYSHGEKQAVMYIWQFGILNWVTVGRTWESFISLLNSVSNVLHLSDKIRLIIYVHNLPFEFQFLRKLIEWDKVFLLDKRKPVYALYGGIEFRCSLKLASKSLEKVGEDLTKYKVKKLSGDLDYELTRFHSTPLTDKELGYCENDIRVLLAYIQEKIEIDGGIDKIPLTNTGYVRNLCREACLNKKLFYKYSALMQELILTPEEYAQLKRGFSGGFTHASAKYVAEGKNKPLEDVGSFDFTSSYPAVMLLERFPMSRAEVVESLTPEEFERSLKRYCCLFDVTVKNVRAKIDYDHPISESKLILPKDKEERERITSGWIVDNGRIVDAEEMTMTVTELDWATFNDFYDYDKESIQIHSFRRYEKGYLPKPFYMAILELYGKKTRLKDVPGEEINYMISKNMMNSAYGMIVTDIVRDELKYDNVYGYKKPVKPDLEEAIEKYNKSKKRFLFYPWGVWVTAYARRNLFSGILACKDDYIYSDTDSIKILNPEKHMDYINEYNNQILSKIKRASTYLQISEDLYSPANIKGKRKMIGVWDYEGKYKRFKTLGAKRYMFERYPEDINKDCPQYVITISGVNKKKACEYLVKTFADPFDGFTHKLCVPEEYSGRLTLTYIDEPCSGIGVDYLENPCNYYEETSIHMEPSQYELTLSDKYKSFLYRLFDVEEDSW